MKMKETKGVVMYITRVETMANQHGGNGEMMHAKKIVEKILR